jgi:hypothetical protein
MMMKYQISRGGKIIGTFNSEDIAAGIKSGSLVPSDHYWHEGMTDWLPLAELLAIQRDARFTRIRNIASIIIVIVVLIGVIAFAFNRNREKVETERIASENAQKAMVSAKIQSLKEELVKCEAFLADFEIVGKESADSFDKKRPIHPGFYKYKKTTDSGAPPRPDYRDQLEGKYVPRFDLIINMRGDDKIDLSVWAVTFTPLKKRYPLDGTGTKVQISVDGNVVEIGDVFVDESKSTVKTLYSTYTSIDRNLAELRELITKNRGKPIYVRFTTEGEGQITEKLHNEEERFLKYFELADVLEKKKKLTLELRLYTK